MFSELCGDVSEWCEFQILICCKLYVVFFVMQLGSESPGP
jgi:hypothetical protein